jgi:hypothetical protein
VPADVVLLARLLSIAALTGSTIEYIEVVRRRRMRRAAAKEERRFGVADSDLLRRARDAWWAGSEELTRVGKLPGASLAVGSRGVLPIGDSRVERGALNLATTKLATLLATLQTATTTARDWGAEIELADLNLPTQVQTVEAQTRHVRGLREKYEAG